MRTPPVIVIVGAGFSGVVSATLLLRGELPAGTKVILLERPGHGIGGVAYDASSERLLLNVRAERMSAFTEVPDDFVDFLRSEDPDATGATVASRRAYGRYLAARLDAAALAARGRCEFTAMAGDALDVTARDGRWDVLVDAGVTRVTIAADAVLLATGGSVPQAPRWLADWMTDETRYVEASAPAAPLPAATDTVVALGSGLTFIDVVVELRAAGFTGRIIAISRHGRLPQPDRGLVRPPEPGDLPAEIARDEILSLRSLTRVLVRHARELAARGRDYRHLLAALRPHSARIWQRLNEADRARFLRHVRALWDVHRHRMPDASAELIEDELRAGAVEVIAGRVLDVGRSAKGLTLSLRRRAEARVEALHAGQIVNCTGAPAGAPLGDPWGALLGRGSAVRDSLGLGVLTDPDGRLLDLQGAPTSGLYYAGPLWRAQSWEATAVAELRTRLPKIAAAIAASVVRRRELA
jgi:uncharacterized NAD(P)/FAD-binding protein YdhS